MSKITLPALAYTKDALEPYISAKTVDLHYSKHHNGYISNLNKLIEGTEFAGKSLEAIVQESAKSEQHSSIFNNAGQAWNHNLYWNCMQKGGGGRASGVLHDMIQKDFTSFENFIETFTKKAVAHFGSGWVWLVSSKNTVQILTSSNADSPFAHGMQTLFGIDLWEHAYYLDYQNRRIEYVSAFLTKLINWDFIQSRL